MTARLHTIVEIESDPGLFGADLAQADLSPAQRFFLAAEGAQLFPGNAAAQSNFGAWFSSASQLNGFGDAAVQSIVTTLKPSDVGALTLSVAVSGGGVAGHVTSTLYATETSDAATAAFTWALTGKVDNFSNVGDEAVGGYFQGNGYASAPTWGSVSQVTQQPGGTGSIVGQEIDVTKTNPLAPGFAFGTDYVLSGDVTAAIRVPDVIPALVDDNGQGIEFLPGHVLILVGGHVVQDFHA